MKTKEDFLNESSNLMRDYVEEFQHICTYEMSKIAFKTFEKYHETQYAIQQIIGFVEHKHQGCIIALVTSMGLDKNEWLMIREDVIMDNYDIREVIDNHFNI